MRQNFYVFSLYRSPDLDDRIFYCLPTSMAAVQAEDVRASFLFVGDLNGHHREWLGSTTTNLHGVATFDFATMSGCYGFNWPMSSLFSKSSNGIPERRFCVTATVVRPT